MFKRLSSFLLFIIVGCANPIEGILDSGHPSITKVMDSLENYELQIIYTQIDSTEAGYQFTEHTFQENHKNYFYPASTVKFPVALLAAEYVALHPELTIDTPYSIKNDSMSRTIARDISQIFAISDNDAYNRLYELLGRDYVNNRLAELGLDHTRISHRLSAPNAHENTRKKIQLYPSYEGDIFIPEIAADTDVKPLSINKTLKGKGFIKDDTLVNAPMDFTLKNAFPLEDQHQLMKQFFFPNTINKKKRIQLNPSEKIRVKKMMATLPRDASYDTVTYYDSYGKFFMYGDTKDTIPSHIKIYNKVGYAYGTLTETAYIVDEKEDVEFLLSATLLVNKNGIFNDDHYEYDEIGIPFMAQLGREFYEYALDHKTTDL